MGDQAATATKWEESLDSWSQCLGLQRRLGGAGSELAKQHVEIEISADHHNATKAGFFVPGATGSYIDNVAHAVEDETTGVS